MLYLAISALFLSIIGHIISSRSLIRALEDDNRYLRRLQEQTYKSYCEEIDKNYELERRLSDTEQRHVDELQREFTLGLECSMDFDNAIAQVRQS